MCVCFPNDDIVHNIEVLVGSSYGRSDPVIRDVNVCAKVVSMGISILKSI